MPASESSPPAASAGGVGARDIGWRGAAGLAALHVLAFGLAYPPVGAWPLAFVAPAPLAWLAVRARSARVAVVTTLLAGLVLWLWLNAWLVAVTSAGYPFLALYLSLYTTAFVAILRLVGRHPRFGRVPLAVLVAVIWTGLEGARGELVFDGYAWHLLAHPLVEAPILVQSADLLGAYFVGFVTAMAAGALVDLGLARRDPTRRRRALAAAIAVVVVHAANVAYGAARLRGTPGDGDGVTLLVIQTNLPQSNKLRWTLEQRVDDVVAFLDLTKRAFAADGAGTDLVVWPETMLPVRGLDPETRRTLQAYNQELELAIAEGVFDLSESLGTPMLVGSACFVDLGVDRDRAQWTWRNHYNSAYLLDGRRSLQRYDKVFLTPFGEVMPYISSWPWLEEKLLALGARGMSFSLDASPEGRRLVLERAAGGGPVTLATPICFEDTVGRVCRRLVWSGGDKAASVLVNLSNDGWFADHDAGRAQHVQIARFRCVENRVPMVRCANTGFSVSIDAAGRVLGAVGEGRYGEPRRDGWLRAPVVLDERRTLYGRMGEVWPWTSLVATLVVTVVAAFGRKTG